MTTPPCDVSDLESFKNLIDETVNSQESIDILVNNAGITKDNLIMRMSEDDWDRVIDVNLKGVFNGIKSVTRPMMRQKYGRIINIASIAGKEGNPNASAYSASKAAVIGLTKSLGKETADKNIAVNCITPATAKTRILDQVSQEFIDYMISKIPRNRFVTVEEIASLITFLASKENSFTTAGVFDISGGRATY